MTSTITEKQSLSNKHRRPTELQEMPRKEEFPTTPEVEKLQTTELLVEATKTRKVRKSLKVNRHLSMK